MIFDIHCGRNPFSHTQLEASPAPGEVEPVPQETHAVAPAGANVFAGHVRHVAGLSAPLVSEYVPAGQAVQVELPYSLDQDPIHGGHGPPFGPAKPG